MKKSVVLLLVLLAGGQLLLSEDGKKMVNEILNVVKIEEFDTQFNMEDFDQVPEMTSKYSNDVGLSEWV